VQVKLLSIQVLLPEIPPENCRAIIGNFLECFRRFRSLLAPSSWLHFPCQSSCMLHESPAYSFLSIVSTILARDLQSSFVFSWPVVIVPLSNLLGGESAATSSTSFVRGKKCPRKCSDKLCPCCQPKNWEATVPDHSGSTRKSSRLEGSNGRLARTL